MSERRTPAAQRLLALQRYMRALEDGEIESLAVVLLEAEHDQVLASLLQELETIYQKIDGTTISELEALQARVIWPDGKAAQSQQKSLSDAKNIQAREKDKFVNRLKEEQVTTPLPPRQMNHQLPPRKPSRRPKLQTLVAVLAVCMLLGATFLLLKTRPQARQGLASSSATTPRFIVAVTSSEGQVYGLRPDNGKRVWEFTAPKVHEGVSTGDGVIVQGQNVYALLNSQVYALRAADGKLLWHTSLFLQGTQQDSYDSFLFDQGMLYIGGEVFGSQPIPTGRLFALRPTNGSIAWHYEGYASPLLTAHNGIVYVTTDGDTISPKIRALRGSDGKQLWSYQGDPISAVANDTTVYIYLAHPITAGDPGYSKVEKTIVALNAQKGNMRWTIPVHSNGAEALQLDQKKLFLLEEHDTDTQLCVYQIANGQKIWCKVFPASLPTNDTISYVAVNNVLYVHFSQGVLTQAYSDSDGLKLLWQKTLGERKGNWLPGSITSGNGLLYMSTGFYVLALDRSGHIVWSHRNPQTSQNAQPPTNYFRVLGEGSW